MPSEFSPGGGKARMTKSQIKKVLKREAEAREIAKAKLAAAKKSDEWKEEKNKLAALESLLDSDEFIV